MKLKLKLNMINLGEYEINVDIDSFGENAILTTHISISGDDARRIFAADNTAQEIEDVLQEMFSRPPTRKQLHRSVGR